MRWKPLLNFLLSIFIMPVLLFAESPPETPKQLFEKDRKIEGYHSNKKQLREAIKAYQEIVEKYPESEEAFSAKLHMGSCYSKLGEYDQAIKETGEARRIAPDNERAAIAQWNLSNIYSLKRQDNLSIQALQVIAEKYPDTALGKKVHFELGNRYLNSGQPAKAVEAYRKFIEVNPKSDTVSSALLQMGAAYQKLGKDKECLNCSREVLKIWEKKGYYPIIVHYGIARHYQAKKDWNKALQEFQNILKKLSPPGVRALGPQLTVVSKEDIGLYISQVQQEIKACEDQIADKMEVKE